MNRELIKSIVNGIVKNELYHLSITENEITGASEEYKEQEKKVEEIRNKLEKQFSAEEMELINNYSDNLARSFVILLECYFKEGLRAGLTNLKFLKEIELIGAYL